MDLDNITKIQLQIIINKNLYNRKTIDENTFIKANERLLKTLNVLKKERGEFLWITTI